MQQAGIRKEAKAVKLDDGRLLDSPGKRLGLGSRVMVCDSLSLKVQPASEALTIAHCDGRFIHTYFHNVNVRFLPTEKAGAHGMKP